MSERPSPLNDREIEDIAGIQSDRDDERQALAIEYLRTLVPASPTSELVPPIEPLADKEPTETVSEPAAQPMPLIEAMPAEPQVAEPMVEVPPVTPPATGVEQRVGSTKTTKKKNEGDNNVIADKKARVRITNNYYGQNGPAAGTTPGTQTTNVGGATATANAVVGAPGASGAPGATPPVPGQGESQSAPAGGAPAAPAPGGESAAPAPGAPTAEPAQAAAPAAPEAAPVAPATTAPAAPGATLPTLEVPLTEAERFEALRQAVRHNNEIARQANERMNEKYRGLTGRVYRFFLGRGDRTVEDLTELEAGGTRAEWLAALERVGNLCRQEPRMAPWQKIATKILGGSAVAATTVLAGGGLLTAAGITSPFIAPLAYMFGVKNVFSGAIETIQHLGWGKQRMAKELDSHLKLSTQMEQIRRLFMIPAAGGQPQPLTRAIFNERLRGIVGASTELDIAERTGMKAEERERQIRRWGSTAATLGLSFMYGVSVGLADYDKGKTMVQHLVNGKHVSTAMSNVIEHGVVAKAGPLSEIFKGNFLHGDFLYNAAVNEVGTAKQFANLYHLKLTTSNFFGMASHTLGTSGLGVEAKRGLMAAVAAMIGSNFLPGPSERRRGIEEQVRQSRQQEALKQFEFPETARQQPAAPAAPAANRLAQPAAPQAPAAEDDEEEQRRRRPVALAAPAAPAPEPAPSAWRRFLRFFGF